jgi:hypothetical protein
MPNSNEPERKEVEDRALRDRIAKSRTCPKCLNAKEEHNEYCWLCTDVTMKEGKAVD